MDTLENAYKYFHWFHCSDGHLYESCYAHHRFTSTGMSFIFVIFLVKSCGLFLEDSMGSLGFLMAEANEILIYLFDWCLLKTILFTYISLCPASWLEETTGRKRNLICILVQFFFLQNVTTYLAWWKKSWQKINRQHHSYGNETMVLVFIMSMYVKYKNYNDLVSTKKYNVKYSYISLTVSILFSFIWCEVITSKNKKIDK